MPLQDATDLLRYGLGCQCTPIATSIKGKQECLWTAFTQQRGFLQPQATQPCRTQLLWLFFLPVTCRYVHTSSPA